MHITNAPLRMTNASQEQQGFYHRGSLMSDSSIYGGFPHEYCNHALHNSNITINQWETIPLTQARDTFYDGCLLSSVMVEQTIIQEALSSIETFDNTKANLKLGKSPQKMPHKYLLRTHYV